MKILKASAGSGKTFRLSNTYIELLEKAYKKSHSTDAYRHILAVTFTNKATAEMKSRILGYLYERSKKEPWAEEVLVSILHDYGAFAVSTIDKFFQLTLRAFSREIGHFADYQIELDQDSLIQEAIDRILDSLSEEQSDTLDWIKECCLAKEKQGSKLNIEKALTSIGSILKNDEYQRLSEKLGINADSSFSLERVRRLKEWSAQTIKDFTDWRNGLPTTLGQVKSGGRINIKFDHAAFKKHPDWKEYYDAHYHEYQTALEIQKYVFSLGLAAEFFKEFGATLKERNLMVLDESNTLLRDIIGGSDAPFVYEKVGTRYDCFLLDEFQDTSDVQWDNFLPLLRESESRGGDNLVVGDVKQSIYRWRGSQWQLLDSELVKQFPKAKCETLQCNWRSTREVIEFNNAFFRHLSQSQTCHGIDPESIYFDVEQEPKTTETQEGSVRISVVGDDEDNQLWAVLQSIGEAREAGATWRDIAIIVRGNYQGQQIAEALTAEGIPILSDDSLLVGSSSLILKLISLLGAIDNPEDQFCQFAIQRLLDETATTKEGSEFPLPQSYHSLVDLCEQLLRQIYELHPGLFEGQTLFVQAFLDTLKDWTGRYGNNLHEFLAYWADASISVGCPENADSVRIMTIHKSKGLEFPYVIVPFLEKITLHPHTSTHWFELKTKGTSLPDFAAGIYPVSVSDAWTPYTYFASDYSDERDREIVDALNLAYVAFTRAEKSLHIIYSKKEKKEAENIGQFLYAFISSEYQATPPKEGEEEDPVILEDFRLGVPYNFKSMSRKSGSKEEKFGLEFVSIPLGERLQASEDAMDFFGEDGSFGVSASNRLRGVILHNILSSVYSPSDLNKAVEYELRMGRLTPEEALKAQEILQRGLNAHPEWFPEGADETTVFNERTLFDSNGHEYRPDRVVASPEGLIIIDYKFGQREDRYLRQVKQYAGLYRKMGYKVKTGVIWFVEDDTTEIAF